MFFFGPFQSKWSDLFGTFMPNPVIGEVQDWKLAEATKSKIMRITTQGLNFEHSGQNAFYAVIDFKGP
jgi:hypothetical protein